MPWQIDPETLRAAERDDGPPPLDPYLSEPEPILGHRWTEADILASLRYAAGDFSYLSQVRFDPWESTAAVVRRIDMLAVENASSQGRRTIIGIEIKTSRSDFLSDVRNPGKQQAWRDLASSHFFAAPMGLVRPDEVPDGSGLLELSRWRHPGRFVGNRISVRVPCHDKGPVPLPSWLVQELLYRAALPERQAELNSRSLDTPAEIAVPLERLESKVEGLQQKIAFLRSQVKTWRRIGQAGGATCARCGAALDVTSGGLLAHAWTGEGFDHQAELTGH